MEILLANEFGFCFGVRRAIELAEDAQRTSGAVDSLGPLVHNSQETERLAAQGINPVNTPEEITRETVVIRAHGARPDTFATLRERNLRIVDATCPFVRKSQRLAKEFSRNGYTLVIVGHKDHPEVEGILGYVTLPAYVIAGADEVATLPDGIKPGVIAQTTVNEQTFLDTVDAIAARYPAYRMSNTVCSATRIRQEAARELAERVEVVYVVGGRHSSNSNRLAEICRQVCPRTYLIETADEIEPRNLEGITRVGLTAGASTPDWLIERVVERLRGTSVTAPGGTSLTPVEEESV